MASVREIIRDSGKDFLDVIVEPAAKVDRSRHLLLVFSGDLPVKQESAASDD